ncbi:MAG: putative adhesin [Myxococcota bacterium]
MAKIIVFSGHGAWDPNDGYAIVPRHCSIEFSPETNRALSHAFGRDLDRDDGVGHTPDPSSGPLSNVPNMRLYEPSGLSIIRPSTAYDVTQLGAGIPPIHPTRHLQVQLAFGSYPNGLTLAELFVQLGAVVRRSAADVKFIWAACRQTGPRPTAQRHPIGFNSIQR